MSEITRACYVKMDFYIISINVLLTYKIIGLGPKRPCSNFAYKQHTRKSAKSHSIKNTSFTVPGWELRKLGNANLIQYYKSPVRLWQSRTLLQTNILQKFFILLTSRQTNLVPLTDILPRFLANLLILKRLEVFAGRMCRLLTLTSSLFQRFQIDQFGLIGRGFDHFDRFFDRFDLSQIVLARIARLGGEVVHQFFQFWNGQLRMCAVAD